MEMESRSLAQGHRPLPVKSCSTPYPCRCCEACENGDVISTLPQGHSCLAFRGESPKRERLAGCERIGTNHRMCTCRYETTDCKSDGKRPSHAPNPHPFPHRLPTNVTKSENGIGSHLAMCILTCIGRQWALVAVELETRQKLLVNS